MAAAEKSLGKRKHGTGDPDKQTDLTLIVNPTFPIFPPYITLVAPIKNQEKRDTFTDNLRGHLQLEPTNKILVLCLDHTNKNTFFGDFENIKRVFGGNPVCVATVKDLFPFPGEWFNTKFPFTGRR